MTALEQAIRPFAPPYVSVNIDSSPATSSTDVPETPGLLEWGKGGSFDKAQTVNSAAGLTNSDVDQIVNPKLIHVTMSGSAADITLWTVETEFSVPPVGDDERSSKQLSSSDPDVARPEDVGVAGMKFVLNWDASQNGDD